MEKIPTNINNIINEFTDGVYKILGNRLKKIILYGSYARGDFKKNSDIDIMILTDLSDDEIAEYRNKIWSYAFEIEYNNNFDVTLSPLIKNIDKFDYLANDLPFYMNVEKEGVILSEQ